MAKIVVEHLGVAADKVTENASFIDDLGADSLDTVELVEWHLDPLQELRPTRRRDSRMAARRDPSLRAQAR
jgi:hypothetical protein